LIKFHKVIDAAKTISGGPMTPLKPILTTFEAIISANTKPYANMGLIDEKKTRVSKIS
jgi:hypothetical protein